MTTTPERTDPETWLQVAEAAKHERRKARHAKDYKSAKKWNGVYLHALKQARTANKET